MSSFGTFSVIALMLFGVFTSASLFATPDPATRISLVLGSLAVALAAGYLFVYRLTETAVRV